MATDLVEALDCYVSDKDSSPGLRCGQGPVAAVPGAAAVGGYDSEMVSSVCR